MMRILLILLVLGLIGLLAIVLINLRINSYLKTATIQGEIPGDKRVAIVLGARVWEGGAPSHTLYDRVFTAVELYKAGKISKLLMTGGNDEPDAMKKLALELGVPESDIVTDHLGLRTYDSCFRANRIFEVNRAIVVTQDYHLPRALYLCHNMGIDAIGVDAKRRDYVGENRFWFREYFSRVMAWYEINFQPFPPEPDEKQPIVP
jgi:vancomycin permeability regulator SanA